METPNAMWLTIVVIVAVVLLIIILIWMCLERRYRKRGRIFRPVQLISLDGDVGDTAVPKMSYPAEELPNDEISEIPREQQILGEKIGSSRFGDVKRAEARLICKPETITTVVEKSFKDLTSQYQPMILDSKLEICAIHSKHLNVVSLLVACTTNISYAHTLVITEHYRFCKLRDYLWNRRARLISQIRTVTGKITAGSSHLDYVDADSSSVGKTNCDIMTLTSDQGIFNHQEDYEDDTRDLLGWAWQVAHAMKYLGSKGILQGNLTARNIFLADNKVVKICDFGSAKILDMDEDVESKEQDFISVPWSAVESMRDRVFSVRSHIWFYGTVLWEYFNLGEAPQDKKELETLYDELVDRFSLQTILRDWALESSWLPYFTSLSDHGDDDSSDDSEDLYLMRPKASHSSPPEAPKFSGWIEYIAGSKSKLGKKTWPKRLAKSDLTPADHEDDDSSDESEDTNFVYSNVSHSPPSEASKYTGWSEYIAMSKYTKVLPIPVEGEVPMGPVRQYLQSLDAEPKIDDPAESIPVEGYVPMRPVGQYLESPDAELVIFDSAEISPMMGPVGQYLDIPDAELKIGDPAELLPYNEIWEFPRKQLILGERIGGGKFGNVIKAEARLNHESEAVTTVAVKSVVYRSDSFQRWALDCEIKILIYLGQHLNVVNLLGACTENMSGIDKTLMIMEFCRFGSVRDYLLKRRAHVISEVDVITEEIAAGSRRCTDDVAATSTSLDTMNCRVNSMTEDICTHGTDTIITLPPDEGANHQEDSNSDNRDDESDPIYARDLLTWAWQVAHGMKYLGSKGILHGDLAARNILLTDDKVVKICDFGLSKILHRDRDAENKRQEFISIPWSASETIRDHLLSKQSDVWSYGIVLWEFFSLCETPHSNNRLETLRRERDDRLRLERPKYATQDIYQVMLHCWAEEPSQRPTFNEIAKCIGNLLDESVKTHYINLSALGVQPYVDALELGERDLSSIEPPDIKSGGTNLQVDVDAQEHNGSGGYLTASQFRNQPSFSHVKVDIDAPEYNGSGGYLTASQFRKKSGAYSS